MKMASVNLFFGNHRGFEKIGGRNPHGRFEKGGAWIPRQAHKGRAVEDAGPYDPPPLRGAPFQKGALEDAVQSGGQKILDAAAFL